MKTSRYSDSQIMGILKQAEAGMQVPDLCHLHYPNHIDAFWSEVDKVLSDYKKRYEWLKYNGARLDIDIA